MLTLKQHAHTVPAHCPHSACWAFDGFHSGGLDQLPLAERTNPGWKGEFHRDKALAHPGSLPHSTGSWLPLHTEHTLAEAVSWHNAFSYGTRERESGLRDSDMDKLLLRLRWEPKGLSMRHTEHIHVLGERWVHHCRQDPRSGWAEHLRRSRTSRPVPSQAMSIRRAPEARQMVARSSVWLFEEVFKIRGPQSLLFVFVLSKVSQQGHDFVFKYFWGWFCFCSPVVNIPVVTRLINQAIVEVQLFLRHVLQMFLSEEAKQDAVFQHSPLSALIEQPGSFGFYGFISSLLPRRQRDFNHILLGIVRAVTSVAAST